MKKLLLFLLLPTLVSCGGDKFNESSIRSACVKELKWKLREPESYKRGNEPIPVKIVGSPGSRKARYFMNYRSKNGFGGYVTGNATCYATEKDGKISTKLSGFW